MRDSDLFSSIGNGLCCLLLFSPLSTSAGLNCWPLIEFCGWADGAIKTVECSTSTQPCPCPRSLSLPIAQPPHSRQTWMDKQNNSSISKTDYCLLRTSNVYFWTIHYYDVLIISSHKLKHLRDSIYVCCTLFHSSPCWNACNCVGLRRFSSVVNWEWESFCTVCELIFYELRVGFEPNRDLDVHSSPSLFIPYLHCCSSLTDLYVCDCIHSFLALWLIVNQAKP